MPKIGEKYNKDRSTVDTAREIRRDLRKAFGKGWKFSVRSSVYSMGCSITVELRAAPVCLYTGATENRPHHAKQWAFSTAGQLAIDTMQEILDSHNRRDVDSQSDYYNVAFSGFAEVCPELRNKQLAAKGLR